MRASEGLSENSANGGGGKCAVDEISRRKSAAEPATDGKSAVDDGDWFAKMAQALHPEKPGTVLWTITGVDERLCQRYAAGHTRPPAYFLRSLLRSEGGWTYLAFLMDGSKATWWRDLQRARRVAVVLNDIS